MSWLRLKASFFIYLALYVSAEPMARQMTQQVYVKETKERIKGPLHHQIALGTFRPFLLCDTKAHENLASVEGQLIRLRTHDDQTFCEAQDAFDYALQTFSNYTESGLETRQVAGASILLVKVEYSLASGFVGTLSLAGVASIAGIAFAIVGVWYLAKYLSGKTESSAKRDLLEYPDTCCAGPPPPPPLPKVYVSWEDAGMYDMITVNEDRDRDSSAASTCVQQIENWDSKATGGCCVVHMIGTKGFDYRSAIGAAAIGPKDGAFVCHLPPAK